MERINARCATKKRRLIDYARRVFADLLREREPKAPKWVADLINTYYWAKQGILPDNRGLNYNNPHLLEALEALSEEEAKWLKEQMPETETRTPIRITDPSDIVRLKEKALKSAQDLASKVVQRILDGS